MNFLIIFICISLMFVSLFTILVKNPIHSILLLILVFVYMSSLLILLQLDFLAMIFLIIYIGAISVLFLFIVMMLNIRMIELEENENKLKYIPISILLILLVLIQLFFILFKNNINILIEYNNLFDVQFEYSYLQILGMLIYTYYKEYFLLSGLVLFIVMIGVIVLTLNLNIYSKKQDLFLQINRNYKNTIKKNN